MKKPVENVFHKTGDGKGKSRLEQAQELRETLKAIIQRSHPSAHIGIDEVRDYAGAKIVCYRAETAAYAHHRLAVFKWQGGWSKDNDIIVRQD